MIVFRSPAAAKLRPTRRARTAALAATLGVTLCGCLVGPNYHRPAPLTAQGYAPTPLPDVTSSTPGVKSGDAERFVMGRDIPFAWWKAFGSPKLDALVDRALRNSPTLPAAIAALKEAQEEVKAQRGFFYPTVQPEFQPTRQKIAGNLSGNDPGIQGNGTVIAAPPSQPVTFNFFTAQATLSYTPDVFGLNRRQVESLKAQAAQQRYQMEAAYITLTSNVVAAAIQEASLQGQIKATQGFIADTQRALAILRDQQRAGYVMRLDVAGQESSLAQAQALLPPLQKQLEQTHDLIRQLAGSLPGDRLDDDFDIDSWTLPKDLPVSLPVQLIDQRPDVRQAEEQVHAASAEVGVALANRLPQITLNATAGGEASAVAQLFAPGGPFYSFIGDLTATAFDGGTLRHRQRAAEQALLQARAQYRETLITAVQNVADTLHAVSADADGLKAAAAAETAARVAREVTRAQYDVGFTNYQAFLLADGAYRQAIVLRVQAQTNRFGDAAMLFQALGGGWWNRKA